MAFSPDGRNLAAGIGRQVMLYDVGTSKAVATLGDHPGPITWVGFTPDGASLVAAGGRAGQFGSVTVWDVAKRQRRLSREGTLRFDPGRRGRTRWRRPWPPPAMTGRS